MRSAGREIASRQESPAISRPISPQDTISSRQSSSHDRSHSVSSTNGHGYSPSLAAQEPDLDDQLTTIIQHISSETTGAMHKEGITELHHFLKAHPHKKPKVDKMLESTGPAFRKYITRALASRAAEDEERNVAVANTLSKLESNSRERLVSQSSTTSSVEAARVTSPTSPMSPQRSSISDLPPPQQEKLSRLHDLFQYRSSATSVGSSQGRATPTTFSRPPPS